MVELINPPESRTLLPPLLACLPTAFVSPRPPPALLPLLSPILRQRVKILSDVSTSANESWLRLLCWDDNKAERLQTIVDGVNFEPHPVSGEIELPDDMPVMYKRIDDETLRAQCLLPEFNLAVVYVWCPTDEEGGGRGWRMAELLPREGPAADEHTWASSISEANVQAKESLYSNILDSPVQDQGSNQNAQQEEDDDADYWAQYDATPNRTPGPKTPAPAAAGSSHIPLSGLSEASYFSQYGDVQPALDSHDPEEEQAEIGPTSLSGDMISNLLRRQNGLDTDERARTNGYTVDDMPNDHAARSLSHPRPASGSISSSHSDTVARLEQEAASQSNYDVGVKQHIGTSIKSLFRLAQATGMSRVEFQAMVQTELELLDLTDLDN